MTVFPLFCALGFPEFVSYPEFCRLYGALMPVDEASPSMTEKEKAEFILSCAEVEKSTYRLGLSRVFFRAGTLAKLDRQVEETTHDTIVQFQVRRSHDHVGVDHMTRCKSHDHVDVCLYLALYPGLLTFFGVAF